MVEREKYKNQDKLIFPDGKRKSPVLAGFLSFVVAGVGQIYLGQTRLGVAFIIFALVFGGATAGIGYIIVCVLSIIFASLDAQKLNNGEPIHKWRGKVRVKKEYRQ